MLTLINDHDNLTLAISILGFTNEKDENLDVQVEVAKDGKAYSSSGQFLEARDIFNLREWIRGVFRNQSGYTTDLYFANDKLSFHYIASTQNTIIISIQIITEDIPGFDIVQDFAQKYAKHDPDMYEAITHRDSECPRNKIHLYFDIEWEEIPYIRKEIKLAGKKYPQYRNKDYGIDFEPQQKKALKDGKSIVLRNELNDVTFEMTSFGYAHEEGPWITTRLTATQGENYTENAGQHIESYELSRIGDWFIALSEWKLPSDSSLRFIEPNISFHFLESTSDWVLIGIELEFESELDFIPIQIHAIDAISFSREEQVEYYYNFHNYREMMIFELHKEDLNRITKGLADMIAELPERF